MLLNTDPIPTGGSRNPIPCSGKIYHIWGSYLCIIPEPNEWRS